jgi:hypothetical protein
MSYEYPVDVKGLWSKLADQCARSGQSFRAMLAYGGARFPCLADQAKVTAHQHQLEQYVQAAKDFPVAFERRVVSANIRAGSSRSRCTSSARPAPPRTRRCSW